MKRKLAFNLNPGFVWAWRRYTKEAKQLLDTIKKYKVTK